MKNLILIAGLIFVSAPAFASRARLESLGEGKNGSFYIADQRNMFLNPAQISSYKKSLALEYGADSQVADTTQVSKAQGTFINTFGDFTYGITLGNESDTTQNLINGTNAALTALGSTGTGFIAPDRYIEATIAGDAGVKWGLSVIYAGNETKTAALTRSASQLAARLGVTMDSLQLFGTVAILSNAKGADTLVIGNPINNDLGHAWKGKLGLDLGATYAMDDFTFFGNFATNSSQLSVSTDAATTTNAIASEFSATTYAVGAGYQKEMTKGVKAFSRLSITMASDETKSSDSIGVAAGTLSVSGNNKSWNVPLVLGAEAEALSWLVLRGSISQSLLGQNASAFSNTRNSVLDSTTVALGTGMTFGAVGIDALASNNASAAGVTAGTSGNAAGSFGFGSNMLYRLAMNYKF